MLFNKPFRVLAFPLRLQTQLQPSQSSSARHGLFPHRSWHLFLTFSTIAMPLYLLSSQSSGPGYPEFALEKVVSPLHQKLSNCRTRTCLALDVILPLNSPFLSTTNMNPTYNSQHQPGHIGRATFPPQIPTTSAPTLFSFFCNQFPLVHCSSFKARPLLCREYPIQACLAPHWSLLSYCLCYLTLSTFGDSISASQLPLGAPRFSLDSPQPAQTNKERERQPGATTEQN